jgi:hypothetical protein
MTVVIYLAYKQYTKADEVMKQMELRGVRKPPGTAWIEHDGKVHKFIMADITHPKSKEMYV